MLTNALLDTHHGVTRYDRATLSSALEGDENQTPLILVLDESETWLHPTAQL